MLILFFILWILLSGRVTVEILCFGVVIAALLFYFLLVGMGWSWGREWLLLRSVPMLLLYALNLLWETAKAAAAVLRLAFRPSGKPDPVLVEFRSGLERESLNVLLANSITLTPGTITVFQEKDRFVVHALRREWAQGMEDSSFVRLLRRFPK